MKENNLTLDELVDYCLKVSTDKVLGGQGRKMVVGMSKAGTISLLVLLGFNKEELENTLPEGSYMHKGMVITCPHNVEHKAIGDLVTFYKEALVLYDNKPLYIGDTKFEYFETHTSKGYREGFLGDLGYHTDTLLEYGDGNYRLIFNLDRKTVIIKDALSDGIIRAVGKVSSKQSLKNFYELNTYN